MRLYTVLLYFLQTALHVSDDTLIHHQEHTQTVITTSGIGRTVFATVRWRGGDGKTHPRQRTVAKTVRPVPDVVITLWMCFWWWMRVSFETCRAVCRKYNKTVYSRMLLDNYWHSSLRSWRAPCDRPNLPATFTVVFHRYFVEDFADFLYVLRLCYTWRGNRILIFWCVVDRAL